MTEPLYRHVEHVHVPRKINDELAASKAIGTFNQRIAVWLTRGVGTMTCAYLFVILALIGFPGFHASANVYVQWVSQTFIQLVMLPVLAVGQNVIGHQQELQAEEQYQFVVKMYHDVEQLVAHLSAQDTLLLQMAQCLQNIEHAMKARHAL